MPLQAWSSLACWIAFGLFVEAMIGFRTPALVDDPMRREMFRLAHAHGTLLNLVLFAASIGARLELIHLERSAGILLRVAVLLIPLGFLAGGVWHFRTDPGLGILLVPAGALLLLVSALQVVIATRAGGRTRNARD